jgi:hypothetical protein
VAAPGPSLNPETAATVRAIGWPVLVCQDAWRLMPWADKLYGCDPRWWHQYDGLPDFAGEKWSTHDKNSSSNDKTDVAEKYGVNLVKGAMADGVGFSSDPGVIHYGNNSGYQSINLALLLGSPYIVLVGFDMSAKGKGHFFGQHPAPLYNQTNYESWLPQFDRAAKDLPEEITIINATQDSAIKSFPVMSIEDAIENYRMHWNRAESTG